MKLALASVAARNAAFDKAHSRIMGLIQTLPYAFHGQATAKLNSEEGRIWLLETADEMLDAAEKADAQSGG